MPQHAVSTLPTPALDEGPANFFGALSDPTRQAIFRLVLMRPMAVKVIAAELPVSQPAVSQHLRVLKQSGLVTEQRQGRFHVYAADPAALDRLASQLSTLRDEVLAASAPGSPEADPPAPGDFDMVDRVMDRWLRRWPDLNSLSTGLHLRLRVIAGTLEKLSEKHSKRVDLSVPELIVLGTLDRVEADEVKLAEITQGRLIQQPLESCHLDGLAARGLIALRADPLAPGEWWVRLTDCGRDTLHRIMEEQHTVEFAALRTMPRDDQLRLVKLLRSLLHKLRTTLDAMGP